MITWYYVCFPIISARNVLVYLKHFIYSALCVSIILMALNFHIITHIVLIITLISQNKIIYTSYIFGVQWYHNICYLTKTHFTAAKSQIFVFPSYNIIVTLWYVILSLFLKFQYLWMRPYIWVTHAWTLEILQYNIVVT